MDYVESGRDTTQIEERTSAREDVTVREKEQYEKQPAESECVGRERSEEYKCKASRHI